MSTDAASPSTDEPLPRFGLRHLMGLVAGIAVGLAGMRIFYALEYARFRSFSDAERSIAVAWRTGYYGVPAGICIFVVGCLAVWYGNDRHRAWNLREPGHFVAISYLVVAALPYIVCGLFGSWPHSLRVASVACLFGCLLAVRNRESGPWLVYFSIMLLRQFSRLFIDCVFEFPEELAELRHAFVSLVVAGWWPIAYAGLLAVATTHDFRRGAVRHWSHWWPTITVATIMLFNGRGWVWRSLVS